MSFLRHFHICTKSFKARVFSTLFSAMHFGAITKVLRLWPLSTARYPGQRILVDLETVEPGALDLSQRKSRVHYYTAAGFRKSTIAYRRQDEDYVIYVHGADITGAEFQEFWDHFS